MMQFIITLLSILCCLPVFLTAQQPYPLQLEKEAELFKEVKVKEIKEFHKKNGVEKFLYSTKTYNRKGLPVKVTYWGDKIYTSTFKYNKSYTRR